MRQEHAKGYSLWLSREEWGAVMDGLILERERSEQRKRVNPESCSDARSAMCLDLIQKIGTPATLPQGATMTTLEELREAVERYRNPYGYSDSEVFAAEAILIADCLTDPNPISKEVLEGMGFAGGKLIVGHCMIDYPPLSVGDFEFETLDLRVVGASWESVNPQPRTRGDLYSLLLRLGHLTPAPQTKDKESER
jgi:hypothetical protein